MTEDTNITFGRKSKRWIAQVGGLMAVIIVTFTAGIVIWQTQKSSTSENKDEVFKTKGYGEFSKAAVSCDAPLCADIGKSMLERGGSVADAAIASLLCMGVIHSQSMGIGGGFLMVMYNATERKSRVLNARETAPSFAHEDMFKGNASLAQTGGLAVGIPGEIKGYWELHKQAGVLPWKELFQPTIKLCNEGFPVTHHTAGAFKSAEQNIIHEPSLAEIFIDPQTGKIFQEGDTIYRKQLAKTFELIAEKGGDEFYTGGIGKQFLEDLNEFGGNMTDSDLANYRVSWPDTIEVKLKGNLTLHAVPPPGSGVLMAFILKILDAFDFNPNSIIETDEAVRTYQRITEAFKHAYAKRTGLGDPYGDVADKVNQLMRNLTTDSYVNDIRNKIHDDLTNNTYEYYGAEFVQPEDHGTAHVSVIGPNGDAIAVTSTVNLYFGAKIRSMQTGIIYNDEMDDFSSPNVTNYFGVPPSPNNFIRPGKRPLSSMTPAIITDSDGRVRLTLGTAGGTKITTATTWVAIRNLWFEENIKDAITAPRLHHQLYPMELHFEKGFPTDYANKLNKFGHVVKYLDIAGSVTAGIAGYPNGTLIANTDFRKGGSVAGY